MDLAAVFLLSLLGGYLFASFWALTAYNIRRIDGHHLYFRAALYGIVLFAVALGLRAVLIRWIPGYAELDHLLVDYVQPALKEETAETAVEKLRRAQWVVTAGYSLVLGPILAGVLNTITSQRWALERSLGAMDRILNQAQKQEMPVSLTLNTGKVYIGLVASITDPDSTPALVRILPMFSGYRNASGRVNLTTDYEKVYTALQDGKADELQLSDDWIEQFELAIRADTIVTVTQFSPAIHAEFNPNWRQDIEQLDKKPVTQEVLVEIKHSRKASPAPASEPPPIP